MKINHHINQLYPVYIFTLYFPKILFNIILLLTPVSQVVSSIEVYNVKLVKGKVVTVLD
jgi:hypothetical protein